MINYIIIIISRLLHPNTVFIVKYLEDRFEGVFVGAGAAHHSGDAVHARRSATHQGAFQLLRKFAKIIFNFRVSQCFWKFCPIWTIF